MKKGITTLALIGALTSACAPDDKKTCFDEEFSCPGNTTPAELVSRDFIEKDLHQLFNCREYLNRGMFSFRNKVAKIIKCESEMFKSDRLIIVEADKDNHILDVVGD